MSEVIRVTRRKGRYIFDKDGTYFGLSLDQVSEMFTLCEEILTQEIEEELSKDEDS